MSEELVTVEKENSEIDNKEKDNTENNNAEKDNTENENTGNGISGVDAECEANNVKAKEETDVNKSGLSDTRINKASIYMLIAAFILLCVFSVFRLRYIVDSDSSTQLVMSKHLADTGRLLSKDWYYASELRVFSYQLVFVPLFLIFKSYTTVRILGEIILFGMLLASIFCFCNVCGIRRMFPALGSIFLLPVSEQYFKYCIQNINYIPFFIITFFVISIYFYYLKTEESNVRKHRMLLATAGIIPFLDGLNGFRGVFMLYLPLFCAAFLIAAIDFNSEINIREKITALTSSEKTGFEESNKVIKFIGGILKQYVVMQKSRILIPFIMLVASGCGCLISVAVLAKRYKLWRTYEGTKWVMPNTAKLVYLFQDLLYNFGFKNTKVLDVQSLLNVFAIIVCILIFFVAIIALLKNKELSFFTRYLGLYICAGIGMSYVMFAFTDKVHTPRYTINQMFMLFVFFGMVYCETTVGRRVKGSICVFYYLVVAGALIALPSYFLFDHNSESMKIVNALIERHCNNGYSTHEALKNGNVLTELSDGKLDVWQWPFLQVDVNKITQIHNYGQEISKSTTYPQGKVFAVFAPQDKKKLKFLNVNLEEYRITYNKDDIENFRVYEFYNFSEMATILSDYKVSFKNKHLYKSTDLGGRRIIHPGGMSFGPYVTLYPGVYYVECNGENLDKLGFDAVYDGGDSELKLNDVYASYDKISYYLVVSEEIDGFEARFFNDSDAQGAEEPVLTSLSISNTSYYGVHFNRGSNVYEGEDINGVRYLYKDGVSFGPYITLYPGKYKVYCRGDGLDNLGFDAIFKMSEGIGYVAKYNPETTEEYISYEIENAETLEDFEVRFFNEGDEIVKIESIAIVNMLSEEEFKQ